MPAPATPAAPSIPAAGPLAPEATPAPDPPAPPADPAPPDPAVIPRAYLQVTAREFAFSLSRPSLPAGFAAVELVNVGEDDHDLRMRRQDTTGPTFDLPTTEPGGGTSTATLELSAGSWRLWCSIGDHAELGMRATLIVAPAGVARR